MITYKIILHGVFYVLFFFAFLLRVGMQKPVLSEYKPIKKERLTFEKDIKPIMNTYCGGLFCHHGKPSSWTKYKRTNSQHYN